MQTWQLTPQLNLSLLTAQRQRGHKAAPENISFFFMCQDSGNNTEMSVWLTEEGERSANICFTFSLSSSTGLWGQHTATTEGRILSPLGLKGIYVCLFVNGSLLFLFIFIFYIRDSHTKGKYEKHLR